MVTGVTRCALSVSRASMIPELAQPDRASIVTHAQAAKHVLMWEPSWSRASCSCSEHHSRNAHAETAHHGEADQRSLHAARDAA
jgi:hypothetical protein